MACLTITSRIFRSILSPHTRFTSGKRSLFSAEILGIENYKRLRIFEKDRLQDKTGFVKDLSTCLNGNLSKSIVHNLVKLIYVADTQNEVKLVVRLLKLVHSSYASGTTTNAQTGSADSPARTQMVQEEGPLSPRRFHFGPLVFRLLYVLKDPLTALALYEDKELNGVFQNTTCYQLLMDMLYDRGFYQQVVNIFAALQHSGISARFTPDCTTLAFAALYQLNSAESCQEMKRLLGEAKAGGSLLSNRTLLFSAALSLKQGDVAVALNTAESAAGSNNTFFRNIRYMALAEMGCFEEVFTSIQEGLKQDSPAALRNGVIYSDTVKKITDKTAKTGDPKLKDNLQAVLKCIEAEGLLSPQTVKQFVNRPILAQKSHKISQSFKTRLKSPVKVK